MSAETKTCAKCGGVKALGSFTAKQGAKDGRHSQCKACRAAAARKDRAEDPDRFLEAVRRWRAKNPDAARSAKKGHRLSEVTELVPRARNHRKEWTGPELELAADSSRTSIDVARSLGRTAQAVRNMRHKLRIDPRKARMAGMDIADHITPVRSLP